MNTEEFFKKPNTEIIELQDKYSKIVSDLESAEEEWYTAQQY